MEEGDQQTYIHLSVRWPAQQDDGMVKSNPIKLRYGDWTGWVMGTLPSLVGMIIFFGKVGFPCFYTSKSIQSVQGSVLMAESPYIPTSWSLPEKTNEGLATLDACTVTDLLRLKVATLESIRWAPNWPDLDDEPSRLSHISWVVRCFLLQGADHLLDSVSSFLLHHRHPTF